MMMRAVTRTPLAERACLALDGPRSVLQVLQVLLILLALLVLTACGASPGSNPSSSPEPPASMDWQSGDDPVSLQMQDIARRLEAAGVVAGGPTGHGFLTTRAQETRALTIPRGRCATIVAITSRGVQDLDATLFAPSGDVLAEDVEPDAHPTIQVCAPQAEEQRFYYSLTAYEGIGTFLYASFLGPRSGFAAAAAVLGGQPGVVSARSSEGVRDVRMHEWTEGVARRGFSPVGSPILVILSNDQRVRVPLKIELGRCYTIVALSSPNLTNLDLRVLDDAGGDVVLDDSPTKDASVQLCATRTADYTAEVHAVGGRGEARVAIFSADEARVGGTSGLWLGERWEGRRASRDIDTVRRASAAEARADGWTEVSRLAGSLESGGASMNRLLLPGGRCSLLVADGGRGLGRLVMRVTNRAGRTLVERGGTRSSARARLCTEGPIDVSVSLISQRGEGRFVLTHFKKPPPTELESVAATARGGLLDALEEAPRDGYHLAERLTATAGPLSSLGRGTTCARWTAVPHEGGSAVTLRLSRGDDIIDEDAGATASVSSCAPRQELQLRVVTNEPATVEVLRFER